PAGRPHGLSRRPRPDRRRVRPPVRRPDRCAVSRPGRGHADGEADRGGVRRRRRAAAPRRPIRRVAAHRDLGLRTVTDRSLFMDVRLLTVFRRRRRLIDRPLRAAFVIVLVLFAIFRPVPAGDAHAYWAVDLANPYTRPVATPDAFTYPPPAAIFFSIL